MRNRHRWPLVSKAILRDNFILPSQRPSLRIWHQVGASVAVLVTSLALAVLARSVPEPAASVRETKEIIPNGIVVPPASAAKPLCPAGVGR
jgi:hypothetical protein